MNLDPTSTHFPGQVLISIPRSDRWQIHYRLQELDICSSCPSDGTLCAEIHTPTAALQVWSVVRQLNSSRRELIGHLEQCWQARP